MFEFLKFWKSKIEAVNKLKSIRWDDSTYHTDLFFEEVKYSKSVHPRIDMAFKKTSYGEPGEGDIYHNDVFRLSFPKDEIDEVLRVMIEGMTDLRNQLKQ